MKTENTSSASRITLGGKLLIVVLTFAGLFAANFLAYNYLLRELDKTAAAVDAAGRQRMLSQKIAYLAFQVSAGHDHDRGAIKKLTAEFHETLEAFKRGGPSRDFFVYHAPKKLSPLIRAEEEAWIPYRKAALTVSELPAGGSASKMALGYLEVHSEALLSVCDEVTAAYRKIAVDATRRMDYLMLLLIGLNLLFGAAVFYFAKKNIVAPLVILDRAAAGITAGNFPELADGASGDEVGNLFKTFSTMAATIRRDREKSSAINGLLAISLEHGSLTELLGKFLDFLLTIPWLGIEPKGAIFLADAGAKNLVMAARRDISAEVREACANVPFGSCLCGKAAATGETVFSTEADARQEIYYKGVNPQGHYCVPIKLRGAVIGVLNLYLRAGNDRAADEQVFLEAACAIIAKTIEYKNLEDKAYQAQKMESLGKAAGAIAHDFNNILTVAQGFNNLARDTVPAGDEAARYLEETASGLEKGAALVKQIMAFSRKQPAQMSDQDLNAVVTGLQAMLGVVLEKKIRLKLSLAPGLPRISGNKGQLEQVLINLAVNARDAILPETGELSITTSMVSSDVAKACSKELAGCEKAVRLTVTDTGCGMPEEVIEHIFEPFFTTKPEGQGTGLGLATVYSIVQAHKGGINITSRSGGGTTFDLCFPANP